MAYKEGQRHYGRLVGQAANGRAKFYPTEGFCGDLAEGQRHYAQLVGEAADGKAKFVATRQRLDGTALKEGQRYWSRLVGRAADGKAKYAVIGKGCDPCRKETTKLLVSLICPDRPFLDGMEFEIDRTLATTGCCKFQLANFDPLPLGGCACFGVTFLRYTFVYEYCAGLGHRATFGVGSDMDPFAFDQCGGLPFGSLLNFPDTGGWKATNMDWADDVLLDDTDTWSFSSYNCGAILMPPETVTLRAIVSKIP